MRARRAPGAGWRQGARLRDLHRDVERYSGEAPLEEPDEALLAETRRLIERELL